MKRLLIATIVFVLFLFASSYVQASPAEQGQPTDDIFTLIEQAHQRGEVSLEQKTFFRLYALFGDERLPGRFRSNVRPKEDGTMLMLRTLSVWPQLSEATRRTVVAYYTPVTPAAPQPPPPTPAPIPTPNLSGLSIALKVLKLGQVIPQAQFTALLETAHFAVYYDTTIGSPNFASPDYARGVANGLEYAWDHETGTPDATHLGFRPPPATHGDGIRYEVYIVRLGRNTPAITPPTMAVNSPFGHFEAGVANYHGSGYPVCHPS